VPDRQEVWGDPLVASQVFVLKEHFTVSGCRDDSWGDFVDEQA
jgi:hypothetical protein